ncbi:MAG TPA: hypothetical protein VFM18_14265 [Methanosarcina sp.]|nr:hypothetical protein [Methanosarcina sp.]
MQITPSFDNLLIKFIPLETSNSGLTIVSNQTYSVKKAKVLAAGPGRITEHGVTIPMMFKEGDIVLCTSTGTPVDPLLSPNSDTGICLINQAAILALVEDDKQ